MTSLHPNLLETLQAEFSPPLDSSLIAAIIADYVSEDASSPSSDQLQTCRGVLSQLAAQAEKELFDEDALSEQLSNIQLQSFTATDETTSSTDFFSTDTSTAASSSTSDTSSQHSFSSPLGFLQAAFPHISTPKLRRALSSAGDADDVDMEKVIDDVLSSEYVRELEERGLDGLDEADMPQVSDPEWLMVEAKKQSSKTTKKSKKRGTTFTLVDIRQKQHERIYTTSSTIAPPDPWTQLSSVASYLSTLLPSHSASYFQSTFHSPIHATPAKALRATLRSIASESATHPDDEMTPEEFPSFVSMMEVIDDDLPYNGLNAEERDQLAEDALLALRATGGQPDTALDIVRLLRELESDSSTGEFEWGVYHSPAPPSSPPSGHSGPPKTLRIKLPTGPPPVAPPPRARPLTLPPVNRSRVTKPQPNAWKTIPQRQPSGPHPLAEAIPAYRRRVRSGGNGLGKGGKGDVGELLEYHSAGGHRGRATELMQKRRAALKEAGKAWQRGNTKTRGGEIAFYYAERARELQQQARKEQLDAAREMVEATRSSSGSGDTVDLHGTTVVEAVQIVKDILRDSSMSPSKPLRVITGRGTHSANGVGVLGPAVKSALTAEGYSVSSFDGGLVVRGRPALRT